MLRRFSHLICRSSQAASSLFQATRRWIRALLGPQIQWHEVLVLFIGFLGLVAAQIDMIRDFFPVHTLIKIDAWTGTAFGVVSASFVYKAWWHLLNSGDDQD